MAYVWHISVCYYCIYLHIYCIFCIASVYLFCIFIAYLCILFVMKSDTMYVVWAALLQSRATVTQRKPALIVLVHKQLSALEDHSRRRLSAASEVPDVLRF
jgi:hypothetical protein